MLRVLVPLALTLASCEAPAPAPPPPAPRCERAVRVVDLRSGEPAVLTLVVNHESARRVRWADEDAYEIVVALFADGTAWLGSDPARGGRPYGVTRVDPERVAKLARRARERAVGLERREYLFFDSSHAELLLRDGGEEACLLSAHALFESDPRLVALSSGVTSLGGRRREEARASEPPEWLAFRAAWAEIVAEAIALAAFGEPIPEDAGPRTLEILRPSLPPLTLAR